MQKTKEVTALKSRSRVRQSTNVGSFLKMALLGTNVAGEVGLKLLLSPLGSNVVIRTACCSLGIALPVYSTIRAIERRILCATKVAFVLGRLPFYYHLKFAFLVWLQLPTVDGAKQLYSSHLLPFFLRHQARIDRVVDFAYAEMLKQISAHQAEIQYARVMIKRIMSSGDDGTRRAADGTRSAAESRLPGRLKQNTINVPRTSTSGDDEVESDHEN